MTDIIKFGDMAALRRQLAERDAEIERLRDELAEARTELNRADGLNNLLRLQFNDLLDTIAGWKATLGQVEINILEMKSRIPPK